MVIDGVLENLSENELDAVTETERLKATLRDGVAETETERRVVGVLVETKLTVGTDEIWEDLVEEIVAVIEIKADCEIEGLPL